MKIEYYLPFRKSLASFVFEFFRGICLHIIDFQADLDEKFKSIDAKDKDILELKSNLRDKDRELELAKANVTACEGVIKVFPLCNAALTLFIQGLVPLVFVVI